MIADGCSKQMISKLQLLRQRAELSRRELASKSGVSVGMIRNYEQGVNSVNGMALARAVALADALDVEPRELLREE